jgi:phage-related tail fiber protein
LFVQILDSSGNIVTAAKQTINNNSFRLLFTEAVTGTVLVVAPDSIDVPTIKSTLIEVGPNVTIDTTGLKVNGAYALTSASIATQIANAVNSNVTYANVQNKPNTVAGFGITDVYVKTEVDNAISNVSNTLSTQSGNLQNDINSINQTLAGLATVATSGEYSDLANVPSLANVATAGTFASLTSKPTTISGYGIVDTYTMAQANVHLGLKANTATTLSGYGILDTYTMAQANVHLGLKANTSSLATVATSGSYADLTNKPSLFSGVFADLTSKPTTISGYGITDAYTMAQANSYVSSAISAVVNGAPGTLDTLNEIAAALGNDANLSATLTTLIASKANTSSLAAVATTGTFASLTSKPTTISGYGITDAYTMAQANVNLGLKANTATTLSGYGILDSYTMAQANSYVTSAISAVVNGAPAALDTLNEIASALGNDANLSATLTTLIASKANTSSLAAVATAGTFASLTSKPTTISGYGITDAYTMAQANVNLGLKANTATTLSGYGILDSYTMAQANVQIALKANVAAETTVNAATDAATASTLVRRDSTGSFTGNVITATNFNTTSDARFKTDIVTIEDAVGLVEQLRGVTFNWVDTGAPTIGLIAQEVEEVLPELVTTDEDGYKSVAYSNMVGVLIEAIKDQQAQIDELREMVLNLSK